MNTRNEQNSSAQEEPLVKRAAEIFDDSVQGLDAQTRSRLNQGRQQALEAAASRPVTWNVWLPVGAAAAVAMVTIVMWNGVEQPVALDAPTMAADFEILMDAELEQDDLEMLEELEFYSWLDLDEEMNIPEPDEHVG